MRLPFGCGSSLPHSVYANVRAGCGTLSLLPKNEGDSGELAGIDLVALVAGLGRTSRSIALPPLWS